MAYVYSAGVSSGSPVLQSVGGRSGRSTPDLGFMSRPLRRERKLRRPIGGGNCSSSRAGVNSGSPVLQPFGGRRDRSTPDVGFTFCPLRRERKPRRPLVLGLAVPSARLGGVCVERAIGFRRRWVTW